jgi:hypothetical protein
MHFRKKLIIHINGEPAVFEQLLQELGSNSTHFILQNEKINLFQCWQLALRMRKCTKLTSLVLNNVQLDASQLEVILVSIRKLQLTDLDLSDNPLGDSEQVARLLKEFLSTQQSLRRVNLNNTQLGSHAGHALVELLVQGGHIEILKLANNLLGVEVGKMLVTALCLNSTLQQLEIKETDWNKGIYESIQYLLKLKLKYDQEFPTIDQKRIDRFEKEWNEFFNRKSLFQEDTIAVLNHPIMIIFPLLNPKTILFSSKNINNYYYDYLYCWDLISRSRIDMGKVLGYPP